jgi:hypothetical protein
MLKAQGARHRVESIGHREVISEFVLRIADLKARSQESGENKDLCQFLSSGF